MPLRVGFEPDGRDRPALAGGHILAEIHQGPHHVRPPEAPQRLTLGLERLSSAPLREVWRVPQPVVTGWDHGIGFAASGDLIFAHLFVDDDGSNLDRVTADAYTGLLGYLHRRGFIHAWRMWNFLPDIHRRIDGLDRYQGFSLGRDWAFRRAGYTEDRFPAATAIGSRAPGLLIYALAGRLPGRPVENPRQVSAYRYPPRYGPRPPAFARGMLVPGPGAGRLLISGTASVVGHRSLHPGDCLAQLRETLANLDSLMVAAGVHGRWRQGDTQALFKVYLREPSDLPAVTAALAPWTGRGARVLVVRGEVCRPELAIEIEGVV
jgi:chorismate lyase/3-hydroxybenzoate synthase